MQSSIRILWNRIALILGTGCGIGYIRIAPGTFGSLWGVLLGGVLLKLQFTPIVYVSITVLIAICAISICEQAAKSFGQSDPGAVVFDEIAAFPIVFLPLELLKYEFNFTTSIVGFVLFRFFDILKPWPIRKVEKLGGGLGVAADDLVAGVYAALLLWLTVWLSEM